MGLRSYLVAKIHGVRVTGKSLDYEGSITLSPVFVEAAGLNEFEEVQVVNVTTGERFITYVILGDKPGECMLNGGAARLAEIGDQLIVMAFVQSDKPVRPRIVVVDADNQIVRTRG